MRYDRRLDRFIDLRGGLAGSGMHGFVLDEVEVGGRAAVALDEEACWGASNMIFLYDYKEPDG